MHVETETLLMFAARREHIAQVIAPALAAGRWVVSDRFTDATYAYQGHGRGMPEGKIAVLEQWVQGTLQPDLTLVFDVPVQVAKERLDKDRSDRFEHEDHEFFRRVRSGYLERAARNALRVQVLDGSRPIDEVKKEVENIIISICI
jgi:dTMP kinase